MGANRFATVLVTWTSTLVAHTTAYAQISGPSVSTPGATCSGGGSTDGDCRDTLGFSTPSDGTTFTSRYARNVDADAGGGSAHDASATASHHIIDFTVTRVVCSKGDRRCFRDAN